MVEFIDIKTLLSLRTMFDLVNYAADFHSEIIAGVSVLGIPPEGGVVWLQHDTNQDFGLIHHGSDAPFNRRETLFSYEGWYNTLESVYARSIATLNLIFKKEIDRTVKSPSSSDDPGS